MKTIHGLGLSIAIGSLVGCGSGGATIATTDSGEDRQADVVTSDGGGSCTPEGPSCGAGQTCCLDHAAAKGADGFAVSGFCAANEACSTGFSVGCGPTDPCGTGDVCCATLKLPAGLGASAYLPSNFDLGELSKAKVGGFDASGFGLSLECAKSCSGALKSPLCTSDKDCPTGDVCYGPPGAAGASLNGVKACVPSDWLEDGGLMGSDRDAEVNDAESEDATLGDATLRDATVPDATGRDASSPDARIIDATPFAALSDVRITSPDAAPREAAAPPDTGPPGCPCSPGNECVNGSCEPCGAAGEVCCGTTCNSNLSCSGGTCSCGAPNEACCGGTTCNSGVSCEPASAGASAMCACGGAGEACCPASTGIAACGSNLACAGIDCTCLVACNGYLVQKSDTSLWLDESTPQQIMVPASPGSTGSVPLYASGFASGSNLACAAVAGGASAGSVLCWNTQSASNGFGELGNGTPTGSTIPAPVVTAPNTPLTGITAVFTDSGGYTVCAIDSSGDVWCWGYGGYKQLGNASTNSSEFAIPVPVAPGGAQLTGVAEMAVAEDHICALKTDSSVWCWGSNTYGQIGIGTDDQSGAASANQYALYPTQVTNLANLATGIAVSADASCATTTSNNVYCWGLNNEGIVGNGTTASGTNITVDQPSEVLTAAGGAPFAHVAKVVMSDSLTACLLRSTDGSIWCWGGGYGAAPTQLSSGGFSVQNIDFIGSGAGGTPCYVSDTGALYTGVGSIVAGLTCP